MIRLFAIADMCDWSCGDFDMTLGEMVTQEWFEISMGPSWSPHYVQPILDDIRENGVNHPLCAENEWSQLANGHHRFWCAWNLGIKELRVSDVWEDSAQ